MTEVNPFAGQTFVTCPICTKNAYVGSVAIVSGSVQVMYFCDRTIGCAQNTITPVTSDFPV